MVSHITDCHFFLLLLKRPLPQAGLGLDHLLFPPLRQESLRPCSPFSWLSCTAPPLHPQDRDACLLLRVPARHLGDQGARLQQVTPRLPQDRDARRRQVPPRHPRDRFWGVRHREERNFKVDDGSRDYHRWIPLVLLTSKHPLLLILGQRRAEKLRRV